MPQAHLSAQWRDNIPPFVSDLTEVRAANGLVHVGDWVRELPAPHHIQPCACCLCRPRPDEERTLRVLAVGSRGGQAYVILAGGYECPAEEVERIET